MIVWLFLALLAAQDPSSVEEFTPEKLGNLELSYGCVNTWSRDIVQVQISISPALQTIHATHAKGKAAAAPLIRDAAITNVRLTRVAGNEDWVFSFVERIEPKRQGTVELEAGVGQPRVGSFRVGAQQFIGLVCINTKRPSKEERGR